MPESGVRCRGGVRRRGVGFFLLILLAIQVSGCASWKVAPGPPAQVIAEEQPSRIRVILEHRDTLVFEDPIVDADTLAGFVEPMGPTRVPLSHVTLLQLRKTSALKTFGLVYLVVGVAGAIAFIIACEDGGSLPPCG